MTARETRWWTNLAGFALFLSTFVADAGEEAHGRARVLDRFTQLETAAPRTGNTCEHTIARQPIRVWTGTRGQTAPSKPFGAKLWAQLIGARTSGPLVNLATHEWKRRQQFVLWLETTAPVQCALFQAGPSGQAPRQVLPTVIFPESFRTVPPGVRYKLPIRMQTDATLGPERMVLVLVRADCGALALNRSGPGDDVEEIVRETLREWTELVRAAPRFLATPPDPDQPPSSEASDDVSFLLMGDGDSGRFEIALKKQ